MRHEYAGERLFLTLWVGSLWAIGYLAVPLAFATLGATVAGEYAATLFIAVHIIGLVSGSLLLVSKIVTDRSAVSHSWRFWILCMMLLISVFFSFYLHPEMAEVQLINDWRDDNLLVQRFDGLHLLGQNLYLMLSVLGLLLVLTADKKSAATWSREPHGEK